MLILGLDTAGSALAVGLVKDEEILVDIQVRVGQVHSRLLVQLATDALSHAGRHAADLDLVAVTAGPGSYTGLRLGAMAAKVFAWWAGAPVAGVDALAVLAARVLESGPPGAGTQTGIRTRPRFAAPMLYARRGEVYGRLFRLSTEGEVEPAAAQCAGAPGQVAAELIAAAGGAPVLVLGEGARMYSAEVAAVLPPGAGWAGPEWDGPLGSQVAALGRRRAARSETTAAAAFVPEYAGPPVAAPLPHGSWAGDHGRRAGDHGGQAGDGGAGS